MTSDERDVLREHGEALASINTNIELLRKDLNGRIPKLENDVESLKKQSWFIRGAVGLGSVLLAGAEYFLHRKL